MFLGREYEIDLLMRLFEMDKLLLLYARVVVA